MKPWLDGLIIFGGADPDKGSFLQTNAFDVGFSRAHHKNVWATIGASSLKMAYLTDTKVCLQLGNSNDHTNDLMHDLQDTN